MMLAYQLMGAVAIVVSLVGTWLAATNRSGWLVCVASSAMWFPALVSGNQWAAVANCWLSIGICLRNFKAQSSSLGTRHVESISRHSRFRGRCRTCPRSAHGTGKPVIAVSWEAISRWM